MCGEASGVDGVTVRAFVSSAIDTAIIGFLKGSRHGKLENEKVARQLEILQSVLEKMYMGRFFSAGPAFMFSRGVG